MSDGPTAVEPEDRQRRLVVVALMVVLFVAQLANTIMANGLPIIVAEIGGTAQQYTWVITAGMLANTVLTPVAGKLADQTDIKKLFLGAIVLFMVGSILAGAAPSAELLIAFRVLMGSAMAFQAILSMTILALVVPARARGTPKSYTGAVFAAASVSGPPLGGLIVDTLGWRWCFWLPVPLSIVVIFVLLRFLHLPERPPRVVRFDVVGIVSLGSLISLLTLWVSMVGRQFAITSGISMAMLAAMVACLVILLVAEHRVAEPLLALLLSVIMLVGGLGMGATNQNLVLAVQNSVPVRDLGAATSGVSLFRIMGGVVGIQVLGVIYHRAVEAYLAGTPAATALDAAQPNPADLPGPIAELVRAAYADQIVWVMATQSLIALVGLVAVLAMRPTRLRETIELDGEEQ